MQHHRHPGRAGRLAPDGTALVPFEDAERDDARIAWFAVADPDTHSVSALEGLLCVPTRPGAMRIAAVPHVVEGLTLGDEVAVGTWEGEPMARGELALALSGTIRAVAAAHRDWRWLAREIDAAAGSDGPCWFDVIDERALAASVARPALGRVFAALDAAAGSGDLRWEYATASRHVGQG